MQSLPMPTPLLVKKKSQFKKKRRDDFTLVQCPFNEGISKTMKSTQIVEGLCVRSWYLIWNWQQSRNPISSYMHTFAYGNYVISLLKLKITLLFDLRLKHSSEVGSVWPKCYQYFQCLKGKLKIPWPTTYHLITGLAC